MAYVNKFLNWGITYKLVRENNVHGIENLAEDKIKKENYNNQEINEILAFSYAQEYKDIFLIGTHTGMRVSPP